jgi:shikimate dehydrogenase
MALSSPTQPTMYFIGVTTGKSSIMQIFPKWMEILGIDAQLIGYDAPLHAPARVYEEIVQHVKADPLVKGALVTTHKLDLVKATKHLFDEFDSYAALTLEVSSISKRMVDSNHSKLIGHAKDPISSGLVLQTFVPKNYWQNNAHVLCFGAGGAAVSISLYLANQSEQHDRPEKFLVTDISEERLEHIQSIHQHLETDVQFEYILNADAKRNDALMSELPVGSLVINATGMGKDRPGSPITDKAIFPENSLVWELNYRGELGFLKQAKMQKDSSHLYIEDGWVYFLHGWTQVMAEIFDFELTPELFQALDSVASQHR